VVRHDGGWAYEASGSFSEPFRTREQAREPARLAAREQEAPGDPTPTDYEDEKGQWHHEVAGGKDRPKTVVKA